MANTVVDATTGIVNYVAGALGTTLFNSINLGSGQVSANAGVQSLALTSASSPTEAPSWITVQVTTTQPVNTLSFNWRFATAGEGLLRIYLDDAPVWEIDQRNVPSASVTAEHVYVGGDTGSLAPGIHTIAFRLDGFGAAASGVELTNVALGMTALDDFPTNGTLPAGWVQPAGSNAPWAVASDAAYGGTSSLKSGGIADNQKSELSYSANFLAGNVGFARKVSSELNGDFLQFYIDGVLQNSWSGELNWAVVSFPMAAGPHTLLWRYVKNGSVAAGGDAAWIDSVTLPGTVVAQTISFGLAPVIQVGGTGSVSASATSGLPVSLRSTSTGVCTIVGALVSGVSPGLCTIAATQAGDTVYAPAPEVLQVFSVTGVLTVPGVPGIVSITPGPMRLTLLLQPPANTGGGPIMSYSATCSAGGHPDVTASSTTATVVVPGLVPGVSYTCTATASNGRYASAATPASAPVVPKPRADLTPILMLLLD